jgi:hypothetical protein
MVTALANTLRRLIDNQRPSTAPVGQHRIGVHEYIIEQNASQWI